MKIRRRLLQLLLLFGFIIPGWLQGESKAVFPEDGVFNATWRVASGGGVTGQCGRMGGGKLTIEGRKVVLEAGPMRVPGSIDDEGKVTLGCRGGACFTGKFETPTAGEITGSSAHCEGKFGLTKR
jgi:hypothetical protein